MAKYQAYAEYKDSGVEWLGEIPSHWDLYSLKRSVDKCTNGFWGGEPDGRNDLCVLRVADFNRDNFTINEDKLTLRSVLPKEAESRLLKKGDLLIEKSGGGEKTLVGCVVQFDKDFPAITSNFVAKMTPNVMTDSKYLTYAFAHLYSGRVNFPSIKQTTGIQNLDSEAYLMEKFGFPSKNEQTQIANFLDHETAQIDSLIAKQEKLIELLKEKRQAVISHAVTKGLNPNVKMKDSGVEWLGQVPEHWTVTKIGFHTLKIGSGKTPKGGAEIYQDEGVLFIRSQNVYNDGLRIDSSESVYISEAIHDEMATSKVSSGDILLNITGGSIGRSSLVPDDFPEANVNQHVCIIRVREYLREFLASVIQSDLIQAQIRSIQTGGNREGLNFEQISKFSFALPPQVEQKEIIQYIKNKLDEFQKLEDNANKAIQLMQERRTALISAAVTGKIDVRHWQAPMVADAHTELSA